MIVFLINDYRMFQVSSNKDIYYLSLGSLVNLIHQNHEVVYHNFHADGSIIISVSCIPQEFTSKNVLKYHKCSLNKKR